MPARKSFALRIDPDIFDAVRRWADDELRSVNGQIEYILMRALTDAGRKPRRSGARAKDTPPGEAEN